MKGNYDVAIDGRPVLTGAEFLNPVESLERISFRTGEFRTAPTTRDPKSPGVDFPAADEPVPEAVFNLDDVAAEPRG